MASSSVLQTRYCRANGHSPTAKSLEAIATSACAAESHGLSATLTLAAGTSVGSSAASVTINISGELIRNILEPSSLVLEAAIDSASHRAPRKVLERWNESTMSLYALRVA
jgi:hypothetical protein